MPALQANKMEKYCVMILDVLSDSNKCVKVFKEAADIIDAVTGGNFDRDSIRSPQITQKVVKHITG